MEYINVRKTGLLAIGLREDDELIEVKVTNKSDLIYLVSQKGMVSASSRIFVQQAILLWVSSAWIWIRMI